MFLILLLNDKDTMGDRTNSLWENIIDGSIVAVIIALSTLYGISTLFPTLFG